jgi:hypothetical protein
MRSRLVYLSPVFKREDGIGYLIRELKPAGLMFLVLFLKRTNKTINLHIVYNEIMLGLSGTFFSKES